MDKDLFFAMLAQANPVTGHRVNRAVAGSLLREAKRVGLHTEALAWLMAARREQLKWNTLTQRKWQRNVSRRPARGRHHDSWSIREQYVRIANS